MSDNPIVYPIPIEELMKLWLEYGARLHIASIGDEGAAAMTADAAMLTACDAVAIGSSEQMIEYFNESYRNPELACRQIAARAEKAFERATANRAASADRTADIFATRFGVPASHPAPTGRA